METSENFQTLSLKFKKTLVPTLHLLLKSRSLTIELTSR